MPNLLGLLFHHTHKSITQRRKTSKFFHEPHVCMYSQHIIRNMTDISVMVKILCCQTKQNVETSVNHLTQFIQSYVSFLNYQTFSIQYQDTYLRSEHEFTSSQLVNNLKPHSMAYFLSSKSSQRMPGNSAVCEILEVFITIPTDSVHRNCYTYTKRSLLGFYR